MDNSTYKSETSLSSRYINAFNKIDPAHRRIQRDIDSILNPEKKKTASAQETYKGILEINSTSKI